MWKWVERAREQRTYRQIDRFKRKRYRRVIRDNPPLPSVHEIEANRLAQIGSQALGAHREEVRAIGQRLNQKGGFSLMTAALERAEALSVQQGPYYEYADRSIRRSLDMAWNDIGGWRG